MKGEEGGLKYEGCGPGVRSRVEGGEVREK